MPNQKSFGQESPEEFETRCFLHVYKLLRNKNGEYVTQGIHTKLISFFGHLMKFTNNRLSESEIMIMQI